jgi:hypothetical protein
MVISFSGNRTSHTPGPFGLGVRVFAVVTALIVTAMPVAAARPQQHPLDMSTAMGGGQSTRIIEKQTWWLDGTTPDPTHTVINPGGIGSWDINDHNDFGASGYMLPGATTTGTYRHIFDWNPIYGCKSGTCANWSGRSNWYGASVDSPTATLDVQVCFDPQDRCFPLSPEWLANLGKYRYRFCGQAVYRPDDLAIVAIPGSNGGYGVPTTIRLIITNPTATKNKAVHGDYGISSDGLFTSGCSGSDPNTELLSGAYPFGWVTR